MCVIQYSHISNDGCVCVSMSAPTVRVCTLTSGVYIHGIRVCSHLSSGSCLWAGVEDSGWSARCCRAGGTSAGASHGTAAPPTLCWTVGETQQYKINSDKNDFIQFLTFCAFHCWDTELQVLCLRWVISPASDKSSVQPYYMNVLFWGRHTQSVAAFSAFFFFYTHSLQSCIAA